MSKLDELFAIPDKSERQKEIMEYARSLRINTAKCKNEFGEISEEKLAVLLYDAQRVKDTNKIQHTALIIGGLILFGFVMFLILIISKLLSAPSG